MLTEDQVWDALKDVYDPEHPISVVDLGLIYDVRVEAQHVAVKMTLTIQGCPMRQTITENVRERLLQLPGVADASVELVWDPRWNQNMISPEGRKALGLA